MSEKIRCPICGSETAVRKVTEGSKAGRKFHVCKRYPDCTGRVSVRSIANVESRKSLRLLIELVSLTTIFLFLSMIIFSMEQDTISIFGHSFHVNNIYILFWTLGSFSAIFSLVSLVLMFSLSKAKSLGEWIESSQKHPRIFETFWSILWFAVVITFIAGLVDTTNRLSNPTAQQVAFCSGVLIFLVAVIRVITLGSKSKRL